MNASGKNARPGKQPRKKDTEKLRNVEQFVKAYLTGNTGQRLLRSPVPKLAIAFAAAVGVAGIQHGQPA